MNKTYGTIVGLFMVCLFLLWRHYRKSRQVQTLVFAQLKRYPLIQRAWAAAREDREPTVTISGLSSGMLACAVIGNNMESCQHMTPQGLALSEEWLFISLYCGDHQHHSQIMVFDRRSGKHSKNVVLPKRPHVGGLAYDSEKAILWVTITGNGSGRVGALSLTKLFADNSEQTGVPIVFDSIVDLHKIERASYLTCYQQELIAGSFALKGSGLIAYYTLPHAAGSEDVAKKTRFSPRIQISTTTKVQSIAFYQEWVFLARSFGPSASEIWIFPKEAAAFNKKTVSFRIKCPPYLEQIVVEEYRLYCLFESGATAYRHKTPWPIEEVLVLDIPTLLHKKTGFKRNRRLHI